MIQWVEFFKEQDVLLLEGKTMNIKKELGEKIKRVRTMRNLTQEQLAEMIDISSRSLSNIEVGSYFVKFETLERILKVLDISSEELFANDHIKSNQELIREINIFINRIRDDNKELDRIYKILKCLIGDIQVYYLLFVGEIMLNFKKNKKDFTKKNQHVI